MKYVKYVCICGKTHTAPAERQTRGSTLELGMTPCNLPLGLEWHHEGDTYILKAVWVKGIRIHIIK